MGHIPCWKAKSFEKRYIPSPAPKSGAKEWSSLALCVSDLFDKLQWAARCWNSFQPGIIYLSVYVFYQESIYWVLDTHLQGTPEGTVAVYSVTQMFDFFFFLTQVCLLLFQT